MNSSVENDLQKHYEQDPRIPCQYGVQCYQKNPKHHSKYKHPPKTVNKTESKNEDTNRKRKISKNENAGETSPESQKLKYEKEHSPSTTVSHDISPTSERERDANKGSTSDLPNSINEKIEQTSSCSNEKSNSLIPANIENLISDLFLVQMPNDFYKFYELCSEISSNDPCLAFKAANIKLVGPYDVLLNNIKSFDENDKEKYLRHWRYFYDPPEFQTVLKGNDKDGLHFGYWRDDPSEEPVFVAKNNANVDCKIEIVAENIFGAMSDYLEERIKLSSPFEKAAVIRLHNKLKTFAKNNKITLDKKTKNMQNREKKVVARTFHRVGVVVPYNKKTQLGYRELCVTDSELKKMLKHIEEADTPETRKVPLSKLQEVVRLATIAADECDFGTCLELGHDLFSSGIDHVQNIAMSMLSIAYTHLIRQQFLKIVEEHMKNRKKDCELSVI